MVTGSMPIHAEQDVIEEIERANRELEGQTPEQVIRWAADRYGDGVTLACSFSGPTGMALVDMASRVEPSIDVFYVDTDFLFPETYALVERVSRRYSIQPRALKPRWTPEQQATEFGAALWERDPDLCCQIRKVEPNSRALEGKQAWISGLRRDQSQGRAEVRVVEWDAKFGVVKLNPLAAWTEANVWEYIREHDVPYNPLNDAGFPSIGCTYCTRAIKPGEDLRAGRWANSGKDECGLHADTLVGREAELPVT